MNYLNTIYSNNNFKNLTIDLLYLDMGVVIQKFFLNINLMIQLK
jgi:hypothetical protein